MVINKFNEVVASILSDTFNRYKFYIMLCEFYFNSNYIRIPSTPKSLDFFGKHKNINYCVYLYLHYTRLRYTNPNYINILHYATPHYTIPQYIHYTSLHCTTIKYTTQPHITLFHHTTPHHYTTIHSTTWGYTWSTILTGEESTEKLNS